MARCEVRFLTLMKAWYINQIIRLKIHGPMKKKKKKKSSEEIETNGRLMMQGL